MSDALDQFKSQLTSIDLKHAMLNSLRPLTPEQNNKLDQKLRLDWNYHSNSIEGNTLTASETQAFILHGVTAKGKPFRDYIEMEGHNKALKKLDELVRKEVKITESLIKELHALILVEPYADAKAEINPGKYKTQPNYLYTVTGERIDFMPPDEVPVAMNDLVNWFNNHIEVPKRKKQKYDLHPILVATAFQVRFIQIHPFGDGNGRMARILSNLILMQYGFTPAIIRLENREAYYRLLNLSSLENPLPLAEMLADEVSQTLQLAIDAANGLPLTDPDDLDKKLALLDKKIKSIKKPKELKKRSNAAVSNVLRTVFLPSLFEYDRQWAKLRDYFESGYLKISTNGEKGKDYRYVPDQREEFWKGWSLDHLKTLSVVIVLERLQVILPEIKNLGMGFTISFDDYHYSVSHLYSNIKHTKVFYGKEWDEDQLFADVKESFKVIIDQLEKLIEESNK